MLYIERFHQSGVFLFKHRGVLPIILFLVPLALLPLQQHWYCSFFGVCGAILYLSYACIGLGLLIRILSSATAPWGTSGRNRDVQFADSLSTTGMYSLVRHPLYVGNWLVCFGLMLSFGDLSYAILGGLLVFMAYGRVMYVEETFLLQQYGNTFKAWTTRVPICIPNFRNYQPAVLPFSLLRAFHAEYRGCTAALLLLVYMDILRESAALGKFYYAPWHMYLAASALALLASHKTVRLLHLLFKKEDTHTKMFTKMKEHDKDTPRTVLKNIQDAKEKSKHNPSIKTIANKIKAPHTRFRVRIWKESILVYEAHGIGYKKHKIFIDILYNPSIGWHPVVGARDKAKKTKKLIEKITKYAAYEDPEYTYPLHKFDEANEKALHLFLQLLHLIDEQEG